MKAQPSDILRWACVPGRTVYVKLAGSFQVNVSMDVKELRTMFQHQTLAQPMEIDYEVVGSDMFINEINILPR